MTIKSKDLYDQTKISPLRTPYCHSKPIVASFGLAYKGSISLKSQNIFMPSCSIAKEGKEIFEVELLGE